MSLLCLITEKAAMAQAVPDVNSAVEEARQRRAAEREARR
jgi:hypothetical protein